MIDKLPQVVITGASGFVGRNLLQFLKEDFNIIAIARRSRRESNIDYHPNIKWVQWDIGNKSNLMDVKNYIRKLGETHFVIHLAGFYDFNYDNNPEYQFTNVEGTTNVLELAKALKIKRFIFASSLAACKFPKAGDTINEKSFPNADFEYAISKKEGEINVNLYSNYFSCSIVRFAAVFSDWCEYAPLYKFLETWLTKNYASKILAGKGKSAVTYIHINDLCTLLKTILIKSNLLKRFDIYNASPNGYTTHKELYSIATREFYGKERKAFYLPKILAFPGIIVKNILGDLGITKKAFEKLWMAKYIDEKLNVDSSYTQKALDWQPKNRYHINRRLLFLLVNLKSHPFEWHLRNEAALKHPAKRINLIIYEQLASNSKQLIEKIEVKILSNSNENVANYKALDEQKFKGYLNSLYQLLMACVRSGDKSLMIKYIDDIALQRYMDGFEMKEIQYVLDAFSNILIDELGTIINQKNFKQYLYDHIGLTIQIAKDEIEDIYENLEEKLSAEKIAYLNSVRENRDRKKKIRQLSEFYQHRPSD